jgi:hypothetical protein
VQADLVTEAREVLPVQRQQDIAAIRRGIALVIAELEQRRGLATANLRPEGLAQEAAPAEGRPGLQEQLTDGDDTGATGAGDRDGQFRSSHNPFPHALRRSLTARPHPMQVRGT